ncbi:MAG: methyltransferase domain-containing protein [Planctomycetota bacterium]|nr:methyltransferase domain-containing protein [Planctomycetota bacterium]
MDSSPTDAPQRPVLPPDEASVQALWAAYLARLGETPETTRRTYSAWAFGDHADLADELCELVLAGTKRATAGALKEYAAEGMPIPHVGELSVVTDGAGIARCVIRTTRVDRIHYADIDAEFAHTEGEGDKSLEYWREGHARYFVRRFHALGLEPDINPLLAAERFEVVHSADLVDPTARWDAKAAGWDEQVGHAGDGNRRLNSDPVLWRLLGEVRGLDVLDAGCGTGYLSRQLARKGARVVGVDASAAMVAIAEGHAKALTEAESKAAPTHHVDDAARLATIADASVDRVVSNYVLMDLADLDGACDAIARVLRPGGRAVVIVSHPCFPQGEGTTTLDDRASETASHGQASAEQANPGRASASSAPASPVAPSVEVSYHWARNYYEDDQRLEPAWGRFDDPFPCFERPLSRYFGAFRAAGLAVTELEEPRFDPANPPAGLDLSEFDERRLHRSSFLPYSIAFGLEKPR